MTKAEEYRAVAEAMRNRLLETPRTQDEFVNSLNVIAAGTCIRILGDFDEIDRKHEKEGE